MVLKLTKTVGGNNGTPNFCTTCRGTHFNRIGIAWLCSTCALYVPPTIGITAIDRRKQSASDPDRMLRIVDQVLTQFEKVQK